MNNLSGRSGFIDVKASEVDGGHYSLKISSRLRNGEGSTAPNSLIIEDVPDAATAEKMVGVALGLAATTRNVQEIGQVVRSQLAMVPGIVMAQPERQQPDASMQRTVTPQPHPVSTSTRDAMQRRLDDAGWHTVTRQPPSPEGTTSAKLRPIERTRSSVILSERDSLAVGGMHMVQELETSLGPVAMTTGPGLQEDTVNRDAIGAYQMPDGSVRIVVADGIGKGKGSDVAALLTVQAFQHATTLEDGVTQAQQAMTKAQTREWAPDAGTAFSAVSISRQGNVYSVEYGHAGDTCAIVLPPRAKRKEEQQPISRTPEENLASDIEYYQLEEKKRTLTAAELQYVAGLHKDLEKLEEKEYARMKGNGELSGNDKKDGGVAKERAWKRARHIITNNLQPNQDPQPTFNTFDSVEPGSWVLLFTDGLGDNCDIGKLGATILQEEAEALQRKEPFGAYEACELLRDLSMQFASQQDGKKDNVAIAAFKLPTTH